MLKQKILLDLPNKIVNISTDYLEAVKVGNSKDSGLARNEAKNMEKLSQIIQTILNHHPNIQAIYLFGSFGTEDERPESDVDIALLLTPDESKRIGSPHAGKLHFELEQLLTKDVDLINLRQVSTVLQKEIVAADRCIYQGDKYAEEEFEMLTLSQYQKLNDEREAIIESALAGGRLHEV